MNQKLTSEARETYELFNEGRRRIYSQLPILGSFDSVVDHALCVVWDHLHKFFLQKGMDQREAVKAIWAYVERDLGDMVNTTVPYLHTVGRLPGEEACRLAVPPEKLDWCNRESIEPALNSKNQDPVLELCRKTHSNLTGRMDLAPAFVLVCLYDAVLIHVAYHRHPQWFELRYLKHWPSPSELFELT